MKLLILLLSVSVNAVEVKQPKAFAEPLAEKIRPFVASVSVLCPPLSSICTVTFEDKIRAKPSELDAKNVAIQKSLRDELAALEAKLDDGTALETDRNRAMKLLLELSR